MCSPVPQLWPCKTRCHEVSPCIGSARSPACPHVSLSLGANPAHHDRPEPTEHLTAADSSEGVGKQMHSMIMWIHETKSNWQRISWTKMQTTKTCIKEKKQQQSCKNKLLATLASFFCYINRSGQNELATQTHLEPQELSSCTLFTAVHQSACRPLPIKSHVRLLLH